MGRGYGSIRNLWGIRNPSVTDLSPRKCWDCRSAGYGLRIKYLKLFYSKTSILLAEKKVVSRVEKFWKTIRNRNPRCVIS